MMRFIRVSLLFLAAPLFGATRPNILFVLVDDLRFDDIACAPGAPPFLKTPNIDRIAREGAMFSNAFATTPLCSPSRASFLTGLHTHHHGITDNTDRSPASHRLVTFPALLQKAGYDTGYIGKWHMGNDNTPRPGFTYWLCMKGQGEAHDPFFNEDGRDLQIRGYVTDILTDKAESFVRHKRDRPFALYLAHKALHPNMFQGADGSVTSIQGGGFVPAPRHRDLYTKKAANLPRRPNHGIPPKDKPALMRSIDGVSPPGPETVTTDDVILDRLRMLAAVDEGLGRLMTALEETSQLGNTVIIFAGDHGYFYGEHGLDAERRLAFEETARIPLLMRFPGRIPAGSKHEQFALNIDIAPTILDLAGVKPTVPMDGRSLVPLLTGERVPWRESFLIQYYSDKVFRRMYNMGYKAVRTTRYKYVRYTDLAGMDELYDLQSDPHELRNIIDTDAGRAVLPKLQAELNRLIDEHPR